MIAEFNCQTHRPGRCGAEISHNSNIAAGGAPLAELDAASIKSERYRN
jgi:hypothetical protein